MENSNGLIIPYCITPFFETNAPEPTLFQLPTAVLCEYMFSKRRIMSGLIFFTRRLDNLLYPTLFSNINIFY